MMTKQVSSVLSSRQEFWKAQFEAFSRSGLSAQAFCRESGLSYSSFFSWKRRLDVSRRRAKGDSIEIAVLPEVQKPGSAHRVRVDGVELEFPLLADLQWVASVLHALRSRRVDRC
jgi:hypothetical protein